MKDQFQAVVFDMDGVIFDSEKCVIECWKEVAERHKIPEIEKACRACMGITAEQTRKTMKRIYGEDFPYEKYRQESNVIFFQRYGEGRLPVKSGVEELLKALKENEKKIALASSTRRAVVVQELTDAGLVSYFDQIICGDMVEKSKPEPDIFLKACEMLGVEPEKAFAIEDSYNGVRAASKGRMRTIMVPDLAAPTEEMKELTEVILPDLIRVKEYLSLNERESDV